MAFLETPRFPDDISYGSRGGPSYNTSIVVIRSGHESRNVNWTASRHFYDVAYGVKTVTQLNSLNEFFHAVGARAYGFRYKDFMDCKSSGAHTTTLTPTDQIIGTGDDSTLTFQLIKTYTKGVFSRERDITKPVAGTTRIAINDVEKEQTDATYPWSVDTTTGIVTFSSNPPPASQPVTAGFEFDVPVRFDTDELSIVYENYEQGTISVPVIEIRDID
jgi:uncharacterized protein (TIGR02217 family)